MKKLRTVLCLIAVLAVCASFTGCIRRSGPAPSAEPESQTAAATTQQEADLPKDTSTKRFSTDLPTDNAIPDYNSIDVSGFYQNENEKGETFLSSPEGDHTVTFLTGDNETQYAYKYTDTVNAVNYFYGIDGALYAVGTEDYTGTVMYFVTPDLTLMGIQATTFNAFIGDAEMRVETVYNEKGLRVAAMATDLASQAKSYYDADLMQISQDAYFNLTKDFVDLRG